MLLLSVFGAAQENAAAAASATEFAQNILARAGNPQSMSVAFQNISVLLPEMQESVQNAIFTAFRNANVRLVKPEQSTVQTDIIFSEDWQGYLWIANIQSGANKQMVMKKVARPERAASARAPVLTIRKNTVWQQDGPILDFYLDNQQLVLLEPSQISIYAGEGGQWRPRFTLAVVHPEGWPRDLRGRLIVNGSQITAFLPGTRCTGSTSPPTLDCRASDDPWQIDQSGLAGFFSPRRNFFTGILAGSSAGASVIPFFSAAAWQSGDLRQWMFTGTDGRARFYQYDLSAPIAIFNNWGGNMAAIRSSCGSGTQLLMSSPNDSVRPDAVQAVEVLGREALPVSTPVELAGAVQSMWTAGKNNELVNGVMLVPGTGRYEGFTLSVACGR
ncbi:MAG TPA: hypothetical protein VE783_13700 [Candidatus Limnocylindrales bacterium]|nr:hypothetical protein [Candidatus Limnocylindrales bacterium]